MKRPILNKKINENNEVRFNISYEALNKSRNNVKKSVWSVAQSPVKLPKEIPTLAQDENISEVYGYLNNQYVSAFEEGLLFLGYPYLSQLALRPEYRIISETIADDMCRKWIEFKGKGTDKNKDKKLADLDKLVREKYRLPEIFYDAAVRDGFFGRSHIYIDTGDGDDPEELKKSIGTGRNAVSRNKVGKKHPVIKFKVIEPIWCYPLNYNSNDPLRDDWYKPNEWFVLGKGLHRTRLIPIIGHEVPDLLKPAFSFGGLSLSQMAKPYVDNWLRTRQSVSDLIHAFSVFVLMTNLGTSLQKDGQQLFDRLELFNNIRDNRNVMALDRDTEDFKNVSASLAGLHELQAQAQEHISAVSRIPLVKFTGIQPTGLNASSEGEIRVYYDTVKAYQEHLFRVPLTTCIDFIQLSEYGEVDEDIDYDFLSLWELDEAAEAAVQNQKAVTHDMYIQSGVISQEEVRRAIVADKNSAYSGLDLSEEPSLPPEQEQLYNEPGTEEEGKEPSEPGVTERMERQAEEFGSPETGGLKAA